MEAGANSGVWGNNTNENLEVVDAAIGGYISKSVAGSANVTLTTANRDPNVETTNEAGNRIFEFTGTLTDNIYVFVPAVEKEYVFYNNTSGSFSLTVAPTGHAANGVAITQGAHTIMYNKSGTGMVDLFANSLGTLSVLGTITGNGSGLSALSAANVSSGTLDDGRLSANVTLNNASTISAGTLADGRLSGNVTLNNASTISTGTLPADQLPTVPSSKGGTGLTSLGSADQVLKMNSGGTAIEFGEAGGGGNYIRRVYTNPATWTKPADVQAVKVQVWGGGGNGGQAVLTPNFSREGGHGGSGGWSSEYIPEASIPGPVSVTAGPGTNSYGSFLSATGGGNGGNASFNDSGNPGSNGSGSGGDLNFPGSYYRFRNDATGTMGFGAGGTPGGTSFGPASPGNPGQGHQQGGGGGGGNAGNGGNGAPGLVIVEEYY